MSKMKGLKKTLAVFMAALMVMSCWVFTPISFEAEAATAETATGNANNNKLTELDTTNLNTNVTTIHGDFESDSDYLSDENYAEVYHNVLYTDGTVSKEGGGQAVSAQTQYGKNSFGSNGVTIHWYHPQATLMYDGESDLPRLGVAMNTIMYCTGTWSRKTVNRLGYISEGGNGFAFNEEWHGQFEDNLNFQKMWFTGGKNMGYTSTVQNDGLKQTLSGDSDNHFYGNRLKFTGTMGDSEYVRTVTPTFAFYGDNGDDAKTITATTTKSITIINYKPLKTALAAALKAYNEVVNNPDYYTEESVAKFVELANALVAAKPNNYVNSSKNDYSGYATAAKAAVDAWNAWSGLQARQITFTLDLAGGTATPTKTTYTGKFGDTFGNLPTVVKTGHTFQGFYDSAKNQLKPETVYKDDTTWTAKWQVNSYTANFTYRDAEGNLKQKVGETTYNYGATVKAPSITTTINVGEDLTYTFTGWDPAIGTMPANDTTYVAQYTETYHYADLAELKKQIEAADKIKDNDYYKNGGYTEETKSALDSAYALAKGYSDTTPLSQQSNVNNATTALKNAVENIKIKEITIIFMDKTGATLADGYYKVNWGTDVTVPSDPSIDNDLSYHYIFQGWQDANGNTITHDELVNLCKSVKTDATYYAIFKAVDHTWKDETITSTCTSDGAIRHTCEDCGYTYDSANDDKAHHTWADSKTVIEPTCHSNGVKAVQCTACKVYKEGSIESIAKLDHTYGDWIDYVLPTCTGEGVQYKECSCGARKYQTVEKLTHDYGSTVNIVKATCTTGGYRYQTCSRCGLVNIFNKTIASGHKEATETVAATCTTDGFTRTYCETCKTELSRTTLNKTNHSYGEWTDVVKATCGHDGVQVRECANCKQVEYKKVDKLTTHSYANTVTAPTCTAQGYTIHTCSVCGDSYVDTYVAATTHDMQDSDKSTDATCTSPSISINECSKCDYTEVVIGDKALDHSFKEVAGGAQAATCGQSGYKTMKCDGCGLTYKKYTENATGKHNWKYETKQEGTQLTITATCKVCDAKAETTTKVAEGHNYSQAEITKQPTCNATGTMKISCDKKHDAACTAYIEVTLDTNPEAHAGETETATTPATCTNTGKVVTTCKDCSEKIAEYEIPAKGHSYAYDSEVQGTCKTVGSVTLKCSCGDTKTIDTSINANAHSYKLEKSVDATCTTPAYEVYKCEYCGDTYNKYTDGSAASGHTWGDATVTQNGNLITVTRSCTVCGEPETVLTDKEIDNRHNFNGTVENVKDATCKDAGEIKVYCTDEGCTEYVTITVPANAKAHNNIKTVYTPETCTADGEVKTYCADCEEVLATTVIAKRGHDYSVEQAITENATCTADGKQTYKCSRCDSTTEVVIPKLGHSYAKVDAESKAATCTGYGYDVYKCSECGDSYKALIEANGHTLTGDIETVDPTCTEKGYKKQYCEVCKEFVKFEYTDATGHKYDTVVTAPTCTEKGYTTYTCKNGCGYSYTSDYKDAKKHDYNIVVTAPTCTEKGYTTYTCKNGCGYSYIGDYTDKLGHDFDNEGTIYQEGSCTQQKIIEHKCNHTGCTEVKYEYVDGTGIHDKKFVKTVDPTCKSRGYDLYICESCGEEVKENYKPKLDHDWDYWEITQYPSETATGEKINGSQKRVCKRCGAIETEEIIEGKYYLVTFYNHDGTRLIRPAYYAYGKAARMPDFTPTRVADTGYTYTFKGYSYSQAEINCVTKRMAIMAEYDAHERSYAVTYVNEDGKVLQNISSVKYSEISGAYTAATPTKANDEYYTYTFNSWSINCNTDDGTAVATATYTQKLADKNNSPDSEKPGIFTKFIEWLKAFIKKLFGIG